MQIKNHTEKKIFIDDYKPAFPYVNWQCCQYSGYVHSNKVEMRKLGTNLMENHTIFFFLLAFVNLFREMIQNIATVYVKIFIAISLIIAKN